MTRLPPWLRSPLTTGADYRRVHGLSGGLRLGTVCRSARCPNRHRCWSEGTATFMVLGERCTRGCRFCAVPTGRPAPPDPGEPDRLAGAVAALRLEFAVITMVTRDDLPDGGAAHLADCVRAIRAACPETKVEVLASDLGGCAASLDTLLAARPEVFAHNLETVRRLQREVRPDASYARSLEVLRRAAEHPARPVVKSGLMLGMGETEAELDEALRDLVRAGCRLLTLGQYLAPEPEAWPVAAYVTPERFTAQARRAEALGFDAVASGPLVRSSFRAADLFARAARGAAGTRTEGRG